MAGCLNFCKILCCCFIVFTNVLTILTGVLTMIMGFVFTWGFTILSGALREPINSAASQVTQLFKDQLGLSIDVFDLLTEITVYTGTMGILLFIFGIVLIAVSCIGCWGACCTVKPCLIIYGIFVGLLLITQITIIIIWFSDSNVLKGGSKAALETALNNYNGFNSSNIHSLFINVVQIFVGCCGITNGTDFYTHAPNWNREYTTTIEGNSVTFNLTYPVTCCKFDASTFEPKDKYCPYNNTTPETSNYQTGCYTKIFDFIDSYFKLDYLFYGLSGLLAYQGLILAGSIIILVADRKDNKVKPT